MKLLLVNACSKKKEESRTYRLYEAFIMKFLELHPDTEIEEVELFKENLPLYTQEDIDKRSLCSANNDFSDPMFDYAKSFQKVDAIVIVSPFWDCSFPARLKAYIETICVDKLTFRYTETGLDGLCNYKDFYYISTVGGYPKQDPAKVYMDELCAFLGHGKFHYHLCQGLDIVGADIEGILEASKKEILKTFFD